LDHGILVLLGTNNAVLIEVRIPSGLTIDHEGNITIPLSGGDPAVITIADTDVEVRGTIRFDTDESGDAVLVVENATILTLDGTKVALTEGILWESEDPQEVTGENVAALSTSTVMLIEVGAGGALITYDQVGNPEEYAKYPEGRTVKEGSILRVDSETGVVTVEYEPDDKKKSGCSTGAGSLLALLALTGMSIVSKRRR
ncbi:MAG: hypothetical protein FWG71_07160, partial [Synergistaceae bacterium]|nr:hypothetical protein [Synergistaceae bacterium]